MVPAGLLTVTLDQQRAFIHLMLRTARSDTDPPSTRTVMHPLVTVSFPGLSAPAQPLARAILHGYARLFFGDELCDRTGVPDTIAKHLIPLARPAITLHTRRRSRTAIPLDRLLARTGGQSPQAGWSLTPPAARVP